MRSEPTESTPRDNRQLSTIRLLWGAITGSLLIYWGVTRVIPAQQADSSNTLDLMVLTLAIVSVAVTGIVAALPRLLSKTPYFQLAVVRFALAESIGLYGLVLHFLGAASSTVLSFLAWSGLLLIALFPKRRQHE